MDLAAFFIAHIKKQQLFTKKNKLLVAVSGGIDSVVLCQLLSLHAFDFAIAHCNFQLRGPDSNRDEAFVAALAKTYAVPFFSTRFNTKDFAAGNKLSTQEAARVLRYQWFEEISINHNFDYVLTAHHADDVVETMLMNFFRGSGIRGLAGMLARNGKIIRPLLFANKKELEAFFKKENLSFVQDASNLQDNYTRNFFRNTLLPQIAAIYPEVNENLVKTNKHLQEVEVLYDQSVAAHRKKLLQQKGSDFLIPVLLLQKTPPVHTILFELLKGFGFSALQVKEVVHLLDASSGKYMASATHRIIRDRKHLIITSNKNAEESLIVIEGVGDYYYEYGTLRINSKKAADVKVIDNHSIALINAAKITYPLLFRKWKTGDYFYPLGMQKKKKLSRFFIDQKIPLPDKEKIWVVEMDKKIIWVAGFRIDDRFKINAATTQVLQFQLQAY